MRLALALSAVLGVTWNLIAQLLLGGGLTGALRPSWLAAGIAAGVAAGVFTVWSRRRNGGGERWRDVVATYYLGTIAYWLVFVVVERAAMCAARGAWTGFDLRDHLLLIVWLLVYGTIVYGIALIPLCHVTRRLVWWAYRRGAG